MESAEREPAPAERVSPSAPPAPSPAEPPRPPLSPRGVATVAGLAVALFAFIVFLPSLRSGFIFDDHALITHNDYAHALRHVPRAFVTHFWQTTDYDVAREQVEGTLLRYYRPLVSVSYTLDWVIGGATAWHFHLVNVLLHATAAFLAFRASLRWTRSLPLAVFCALVFAVHPTRVENVVWISGRTDLMMIVGVLGTLECFRLSRRATEAAARLRWTGATLACAAGAIMCKEPAAMLPFLIFAEAAGSPTPAAERPETRTARRRTIALVTGLCAAYVLVRLLVYPIQPVRPTLQLQPLFTLSTIGHYALRTVWTWPQTMLFAHAPVVGGVSEFTLGPVVAGAITIALSLGLLALAWRRNRLAFWLLAATAAFMGPLLNLVPTGISDPAQDRFLYAPLLFGLGGVCVLFRPTLHRLAKIRASVLAGSGVVLLASGLVLVRTIDYVDERTFWESELRMNPDHPRAISKVAAFAMNDGNDARALELYGLLLSPASRRHASYPEVEHRGEIHLTRVALQAGLIADWDVPQLSALLAELRRVEGAPAPAPARIGSVSVGGNIERAELERVFTLRRVWYSERTALLATRIGADEAARAMLAGVDPVEASRSPTPLLRASALARLGESEPAARVVAEVQAREQRGERGAENQALAAFRAKLAQVDELSKRAAAADPAERIELLALREAELGGYGRAVRKLAAAKEPDAALLTQALVASRLDLAAMREATRAFGPQDGPALVEAARSTLPRSLQEAAPAPSDDWRAWAAEAERAATSMRSPAAP